MNSRALIPILLAAILPTAALAQRFEWREVSTASRPSPRYRFGLVFDAARGVVMLFGGHDDSATGASLNDTWIYDGVDWTELHPASHPGPRGDFAMAYDPVRERVVLAGGSNRGGRLRDTWEWDGVDWSLVAASSSGIDNGGRACFDPVLGGVHYNRGPVDLLWSGSAWRNVGVGPNSPAGSGLQMVLAPHLGGVVTCDLGRTLRFEPQVGWTEVWGANPLGLGFYAMASDPRDGRIVLMGGLDGESSTWTCDSVGWQRLSQSLPPRWGARMVFDAHRRKFVLFGGRDNSSSAVHYYDDCYELEIFDQLADYATYGQGCGQPAAELRADPLFGGRPFVGGVLTLLASGLAPSEPVFHLLGDSRTGWNSVPLPFDLGGFGAPGCAVLAEPEVVEGVGASDAAGARRFTIRIPDDLSLVGATFYHQVVGLAPGANPAGLIVTNGGELTIGTR